MVGNYSQFILLLFRHSTVQTKILKRINFPCLERHKKKGFFHFSSGRNFSLSLLCLSWKLLWKNAPLAGKKKFAQRKWKQNKREYIFSVAQLTNSLLTMTIHKRYYARSTERALESSTSERSIHERLSCNIEMISVEFDPLIQLQESSGKFHLLSQPVLVKEQNNNTTTKHRNRA